LIISRLHPNIAKVELKQVNKIIPPRSTEYYEFELDFSELKKFGTGYSLMKDIFCEPIIHYKDSRNHSHMISNRFFMATEERRVLI